MLRSLPRWLFYGVAAAGLASALRATIWPPGAPVRISGPEATNDQPAAEYASRFARAYLTWDAARPERHQRQLAEFLGSTQDADAGLQLPPVGAQNVSWVDLVQARTGALGGRVYTLAADTDRQGILYITVEVAREPDGHLRLSGYPALVGPPLTRHAQLASTARLLDVEDAQLRTVVGRALRNYLSRSATNLSADLLPGARVSLPGHPLSLDGLDDLKWAPGGQSVLATARATGLDGVTYTLGYELDVYQTQTRWEVGAIQADPGSS